MDTHCCQQMKYFLDEGKVSVNYYPRFREYSIKLSGSNAFQDIDYCPWCGTKLPESLRDEWFDILENMFEDFDGFDDSRLPEEFKGDAW